MNDAAPDCCGDWFEVKRPSPGFTVVYCRIAEKLARFGVETTDHALAIRTVSKRHEARPVLAMIQRARPNQPKEQP